MGVSQLMPCRADSREWRPLAVSPPMPMSTRSLNRLAGLHEPGYGAIGDLGPRSDSHPRREGKSPAASGRTPSIAPGSAYLNLWNAAYRFPSLGAEELQEGRRVSQ